MKQFENDPLYRDGRHYDLQNQDYREDIPFYLSMANLYKSPILELACGTGRVTIPIAKYGHAVTGIDISEGMLLRAKEKAKEKHANIALIRSDVREFYLNQKFSLIIFPFNSIALIHDLESINGCLGAVKKHLNEQGRFILDYYNPRLERLRGEGSASHPVAEYTDPDSGKKVVISEKNRYEAATQINHISLIYQMGEKRFIKELNMRIFFPQELDALLKLNGFNIEAKYGDFDRGPFISDSPKQIIVSHLI